MARDVLGLIEEVVTGLGYELVDFESTPRGRLLRVFIDIERGVNVEDCAAISRQITRVFEVENIDYDRLEVSSPGLDRPLKKLADFERFAGQTARVRLVFPIAGQRHFSARIGGVRDGHILLHVGEKTLELALSDIDRARLQPQF
jgi:ribosome maturation factor RimP